MPTAGASPATTPLAQTIKSGEIVELHSVTWSTPIPLQVTLPGSTSEPVAYCERLRAFAPQASMFKAVSQPSIQECPRHLKVGVLETFGRADFVRSTVTDAGSALTLILNPARARMCADGLKLDRRELAEFSLARRR